MLNFLKKIFSIFLIFNLTFVSSAQAAAVSFNDFNGDGTKIHFTNFTNTNNKDKLRQFTLSKPFDISTLDTATEVQIDLDAGSDDIGNFTS